MQSGVDKSTVPELKVLFGSDHGPLLEQLQHGRGVSGICFLEQLQASERGLARGFDRLLALDELELHLYDHQLRAVLRVLRDMRGRAVLADEVGLGKTIEAGVILKEYIVRGLARSALVLAPAALTEQWRSELRDKVDIDCHVYTGGDVWHEQERIITSLDTARRPEHAEALQSKVWDVVIVDEAHRLKNRNTRSWQLVDGLQKKYLLLLTATPIQNDLEELYNMMTLLQPGLLQTYNAFKREFVQDKRSPKRTEQLRRRIGQVLVRTTRAASGLPLPRRLVHSVSVPLHRQERDFYERVVAFARSVFVQGGDRTNMLPLILLLRELCSSPEAVRRTLQTLAAPGRLSADEGRRAAELAAEAGRLCGRSSKIQAAVRWVQATSEPAIVFTQFRATQAALADALRQHLLPVALFHGGMDTEERRASLERFRRDGGVLISTEAGSEGQNLQFCRTVINHDLPWNPMRVEQRIGRVHRLGQTRDVLIVNLIAPATMEMHVFRLLHEKIRLFEQVIGDLDVILASNAPDDLAPGTNFTHELGRIFLGSDDEQTTVRRLEKLAGDIERTGAKMHDIRQTNDRLLPTLSDVEIQCDGEKSEIDGSKQPLQAMTAALLHPLCLDIQFAACVLGRTKQVHARALAMRRRLDRLQFVNVHARPLGRRLLHQVQLMFCFKVAYRSDETRESLHTLLVDPATETVRVATVPENPIDVALGDIAARPAGSVDRLAPYVLDRLYNRAREYLERHIAHEGLQYTKEAGARLQRDKQRLDEFYAALQEEAFIPVVQQLRRLEVRRTREQWLQAVAPKRLERAAVQGETRRTEAGEVELVKQRLEAIQQDLRDERQRRLLELKSKYAVRAEVTSIAAATLSVPRVELRYKIVSPVRQELIFYYDPLQDLLIDLDCDECGSALDAVHMNGDGSPVCADCFAAVAAGSG